MYTDRQTDSLCAHQAEQKVGSKSRKAELGSPKGVGECNDVSPGLVARRPSRKRRD